MATNFVQPNVNLLQPPSGGSRGLDDMAKMVQIGTAIDERRRANQAWEQQAQQQLVATQKQAAIKSIYANNTTPDGKPNFEAIIPQLYRIDPDYAGKVQADYNNRQKFDVEYNKLKTDLDKSNFDYVEKLGKARLETMGRVASAVKYAQNPDGTVDQIKAKAVRKLLSEQGLDTFENLKGQAIAVPENIDANFIGVMNRLTSDEKTMFDEWYKREQLGVQKQTAATNAFNAQTQRMNAENNQSDKQRKTDSENADKVKKYDIAVNERNTLKAAIDDVRKDAENVFTGATGFNLARVSELIPGTPQYLFAQKVQNIKNRLVMGERQKLSGQGQISDKETKMIENSASILSTNLDKKSFLAELDRIESTINAIDNLDKKALKGSGVAVDNNATPMFDYDPATGELIPRE